ncbi:MAG TPA: DinB family protein [Roseiflexaceae bacterium]|nr:DinB family protein [Roseiflexaceae bacterium]
MTSDQAELRRVFTSASLGHTAYRSWAQQARHERRFNIARLFEALGATKLARAEHAFRALDEAGDTAGNVDRALAGLEPEATATGPITGTNPLARDMLLRAQRAIGENRDLRADELDDIYVCSTCGYLREGQLSGACPICGAVPEAHKAFRAIEGMGVLGPHAIMAFLEHSEEGLRKLFHNLDEELLARRQDGEKPSLKELLGHLVDIDAVFRERAWLLLETDRPELPPAHPPRLDAASAYRSQPIDTILEAFHASRRQTLNLLRGLTSAAWHRLGHHELYGEINLLHQGNWVVKHEHTHMIEMAQLRHDLLIAAEGAYAVPADLDTAVVPDVSEGE